MPDDAAERPTEDWKSGMKYTMVKGVLRRYGLVCHSDGDNAHREFWLMCDDLATRLAAERAKCERAEAAAGSLREAINELLTLAGQCWGDPRIFRSQEFENHPAVIAARAALAGATRE